MSTLDRVASPHTYTVSNLITVIVAGWFALTFAVTLGWLLTIA